MNIKELRYNVMLALYFPILLYAFSTFDISEQSYVVQGLDPVVVGEETVVLGQPFNAKAFLTVAESEGQQLTAMGELEAVGDTMFSMPTAHLLKEGENEKEVAYEGRFRFQQVDGEQVEIPVNGTFRVRRPEIVAQSEATQALYRQCLNPLRIEVPGLEDRQLRLVAGGRSVEGRSITLSPSGESVGIDVYLASANNGEDVRLGRKQFAVIDPPRPELRVLSNGREVNTGGSIPKARAVLEFQVQPDQEFRRRFSQDARYRIGRATVYLRRGKTASREIGTMDLGSDNQLVLTRLLREAEPGDQVTIRLENIVRINHAGQAIAVPFNQASRTFGFVLS